MDGAISDSGNTHLVGFSLASASYPGTAGRVGSWPRSCLKMLPPNMVMSHDIISTNNPNSKRIIELQVSARCEDASLGLGG